MLNKYDNHLLYIGNNVFQKIVKILVDSSETFAVYGLIRAIYPNFYGFRIRSFAPKIGRLNKMGLDCHS